MKVKTLMLTALAAALLAAAGAHAQEVRYWGRVQGNAARGLIDLHGQYYSVGEGDEIPGVGRVKQVTDEALIVEQTLTEAEKDHLAAQGLAVYDAKERRIQNLSGSLLPR
jgi:acyl-coenzyme A thioesterase PaaI-like protein